MKFDRKTAKTLSNEKELELFDSSRAPKLNKHTAAELKRLVQRSRTLRDKLTDVKRSQVRSGQAAKGQRGVGAADRSREKTALYSDVYDRFVKRLAAVESSAATKAARKPLASAAKGGAARGKPTATRSAKATTASKSAVNPEGDALMSRQSAARKPTSKGKITKTRIARSGVVRKNAHVSSTNKRNQGKRDSK